MSSTRTSPGPQVSIDVVAALALFAIAFVLLSQTGEGARDWAMPRALNYVLLITGVVLLVKGVVRPSGMVPVLPPVARGEGLDTSLFVAGAVVYAVVVPFLGFWVASAIVLFAMSLALAQTRDRRTVLESLAMAVGTCVVFYVLMLHVFYVPLPEGTLFN